MSEVRCPCCGAKLSLAAAEGGDFNPNPYGRFQPYEFDPYGAYVSRQNEAYRAALAQFEASQQRNDEAVAEVRSSGESSDVVSPKGKVGRPRIGDGFDRAAYQRACIRKWRAQRKRPEGG